MVSFARQNLVSRCSSSAASLNNGMLRCLPYGTFYRIYSIYGNNRYKPASGGPTLEQRVRFLALHSLFGMMQKNHYYFVVPIDTLENQRNFLAW